MSDWATRLEAVKPLIVLSPLRAVLALGSISQKAYRKSLEQGELWWLHPGTDRVLPWRAGRLISVEVREEWVEAVVEPVADDAAAADSTEATGRDGEARRPAEVAGEHDASVLVDLAGIVKSRRVERPAGSYTTYLFDQGPGKIRKKLGEEAVELILAAGRDELVGEAADLIYHLLVLLEHEEIPLSELFDELASRRS